jgi:hypothetical protein
MYIRHSMLEWRKCATSDMIFSLGAQQDFRRVTGQMEAVPPHSSIEPRPHWTLESTH